MEFEDPRSPKPPMSLMSRPGKEDEATSHDQFKVKCHQNQSLGIDQIKLKNLKDPWAPKMKAQAQCRACCQS